MYSYHRELCTYMYVHTLVINALYLCCIDCDAENQLNSLRLLQSLLSDPHGAQVLLTQVKQAVSIAVVLYMHVHVHVRVYIHVRVHYCINQAGISLTSVVNELFLSILNNCIYIRNHCFQLTTDTLKPLTSSWNADVKQTSRELLADLEALFTEQ